MIFMYHGVSFQDGKNSLNPFWLVVIIPQTCVYQHSRTQLKTLLCIWNWIIYSHLFTKPEKVLDLTNTITEFLVLFPSVRTQGQLLLIFKT